MQTSTSSFMSDRNPEVAASGSEQASIDHPKAEAADTKGEKTWQSLKEMCLHYLGGGPRYLWVSDLAEYVTRDEGNEQWKRLRGAMRRLEDKPILVPEKDELLDRLGILMEIDLQMGEETGPRRIAIWKAMLKAAVEYCPLWDMSDPRSEGNCPCERSIPGSGWIFQFATEQGWHYKNLLAADMLLALVEGTVECSSRIAYVIPVDEVRSFAQSFLDAVEGLSAEEVIQVVRFGREEVLTLRRNPRSANPHPSTPSDGSLFDEPLFEDF